MGKLADIKDIKIGERKISKEELEKRLRKAIAKHTNLIATEIIKELKTIEETIKL